MDAKNHQFGPLAWKRVARVINAFASSEVSSEAKALFAVLVILLLGINGLTVVSSYVGRDFITAIELRNMPDFVRYAFIYISVFAGSTVVAVVYRYAEERLGLLWREWLTLLAPTEN